MKGKLLVVGIVVALVSGAGFALANTDAGEALKQWYNGVFGQAVDAATDEATEYGEEVYDGLLEEYEELKGNAAAAIDETRASETENAQNAIEDRKNEHLESLEDAKAEIEAQMGQEFYSVYMEGWLELNRLAAEAEAAAAGNLAKFTGEEGAAALAQLEEDLVAAKDAAVVELEDAVENAKAEITAELDVYEEWLANNWITDIDYIADDLRESVTEIKDNLVAEQQALIAEVAANLTQEAYDALDDVVNNINN